MSVPVIKDGATSEDYWALPEGMRAELIDGELYNMTPPSWEHQQIAFGVARMLANHVDQHGGPCKVCPAPVAVNLDADDTIWVEPDVIVVCDPCKISQRGCEGAPDMVVEVVSPPSIAMDYFTKANRYRRAGVREYWIVDPMARRTTVYRYDKEGPGFIMGYDFSEPVPVGCFEGLAITIGVFV